MRYYCPNDRCSNHRIVERERSVHLCPSCDHVMLSIGDDDHLPGRVLFCGLVGGFIGFAASGRPADALFGVFAGVFLGAITWAWWG